MAMSSEDQTSIWIQESIVADALNLPSRPKFRRRLPTVSDQIGGDGRNSSESHCPTKDWQWIKACILPSSPTYSVSTVTYNSASRSLPRPNEYLCIYINDHESSYYGETISIPAHISESDCILMANNWSSNSLSSETEPNTVRGAHTASFDFDVSDSSRRLSDKKINRSNLSIPPADLIHLTHLHEPAVVNCLRIRYSVNEIYTSTGPILIALNPFKDCGAIYSDEIQRLYWERGESIAGRRGVSKRTKKKKMSYYPGEDKKVEEYHEVKEPKPQDALPPHVFGVADDAFRSMMRTLDDSRSTDVSVSESGDQSILVSGESGAGKTVTTKIIMHYLATLSRRSVKARVNSFTNGYPNSLSMEGNVEQQVLQSNPILESFGNARTIRNDNSSRFGKFIEMQFTESGHLGGANIETYLLEKVRLITQSPGERNYHIFYELLSGATKFEQNKFHLVHASPENFALTCLSGTFDRRDGVSDPQTYAEMRKAMNIMGFSLEEQHEILLIVAALLHTGNLSFVELNDDECQIDTMNPSLLPSLNLLGISAEMFNHALCFCIIEAGGERLAKTLSIHQARKALEALIKATYGVLFTYLVQRINNSIHGTENTSRDAFIGVLDIFGFESFDVNSFEQLCINYCNEALQQQFNRFIFKMEQVEYEREGISWSFISFPDNQDVLDLIDKKHTGILSILDEQCILAKCTDRTFVNSAYSKCSSHKRFAANRKQQANGRFSVEHYAGPVEYDSLDFLEKNKDELPKDITDLLLHSSNPFLQHLANMLEASNSPSINKENNFRRSSSSLVKVSVGAQFSSQLRELRERIEGTSPHYIRCIKPNDDLLPDRYDCAIVANQLSCGGILEAVRVSRVGYPQRYVHERFVDRYRILGQRELREVERSWNGRSRMSAGSQMQSARVMCEVLVNAIAKLIYNSDIPEVLAIKASNKGKRRRNPRNIPRNGFNNNKYKYKSNRDETSETDEPPELIHVGMQMGKTKIFLRRWAFDAIENFRGEKKAIAATLITAMVRRFLARRAYLIILLQFREHRGGYIHHYRRDCQAPVSSPPVHRMEVPDFGDTSYLIEKYEKEPEEDKWRKSTEFKWLMVDGRWVKNHEVTPERMPRARGYMHSSSNWTC